DADEITLSYGEAVYLTDVLRKRIGTIVLYDLETQDDFVEGLRRLLCDARPLLELSEALFHFDSYAGWRRWHTALEEKQAQQAAAKAAKTAARRRGKTARPAAAATHVPAST